ncbi:MAG: molybdopterin-dependent oxidoreductase [Anaerolineae bacterium]|nr:molybdopterin-dependent oxidoreductase [Anaerolineae bacterium]
MAYAKMIGAEVKRKEDPRLITGRGAYVPNVHLPNMHHVGFVRSPLAHANIVSINTSAALAVPGVVAVFTGEDLKNSYDLMPQGAVKEGTRPRAHYPLSVGRVRHVGEAIVAIVATSAQAAADGVAAVEVDYDPLPAVVDMMAALQPDAPQLHADAPGNVEHEMGRKAGDIDAAFANAHKVVKARMANQRLLGMPMETRATVAAPDPWTGGLTVHTSTQAPHFMRRDMAKILNLDENSVRVIAPDVGGGFGLKIGIFPEDAVLGALALRLNIPLKWVEGRIEHATATTHGRAQITDIEAAIDANGKVQGLKMQVYADIGAYPIATDVPDLTVLMAIGTYDITHLRAEVKTVFTNTTPVAAYRGAGRPEAAFYLERLMDLIADELALDPAQVRLNNFIAPEQFPYHSATGLHYDSGNYAGALNKALAVSRYAELRAEQARRRAAGDKTLLGVGIGCFVEMCGFGPFESAQVRVEPSGTVTVTTGISPHGQGGATTFSQILADELGVGFDKITVKYGDTSQTPQGIGTMGSRSIVVGGSALVRAAGKVRRKAMQIAAHMLEASVDDIVLQDGAYMVKGVPSKRLSLAEIASKAYTDSLPDDMDPGLEAHDFFKPPELVYPFGAHVAVVEVDSETGKTKLREYYSVDDCGPRISPNLAAGQIHGGLAQGIAQALLEEANYDENGNLMSGTFMDYAVPRAETFPMFTLDQTVTPTPNNPLGVKGIGEAATIGSTPSVANAVIDALNHLGITHLDIPMKPEKVWKAALGK